jgi:hypothetical protein
LPDDGVSDLADESVFPEEYGLVNESGPVDEVDPAGEPDGADAPAFAGAASAGFADSPLETAGSSGLFSSGCAVSAAD